jgi:DNA-binding winged helix-turn-helix (wHTH) protein/tetratricopeptide (TPR) repeat protein
MLRSATRRPSVGGFLGTFAKWIAKRGGLAASLGLCPILLASFGAMLRVGELELDADSLEAWHAGRRIRIRGKPFGLLDRLARDVGRVVSKDRLMAELWPAQMVSQWALTSAVRDVRRALSELGVAETIRIEAVRGRGYRLSMPAAATAENAAQRSPSATARHPGTLVGRETELGRLDAAVEDALAGRSRTILVTGPAGIGKSRLAAQLETLASARGVDVFWGRCQEGDGPPLWPWAEIVRALVKSRDPDDIRPILRAVAPELIDVLPSLRALFADVVATRRMDPELARLGLLDGFIELLDHMATRRPCVLVVDDVQWADSSSLMLLRSLALRRVDSGLLTIALCRDEEVEPPHPAVDLLAALEREESVEKVALGPLATEQSMDLLGTLGAGAAGDARLDELCRIAAGNPFFLRELYRHLRESGDLEPLPREVERLIVRRLEQRTPAAQRVVACAAVVGMEFRADLLRPLVEEETGSLDDALDELVRAGLIELPVHAGEPHRFAHALTRRAAYARIPAGDRARLHLALGERLEAAFYGQVPAERAVQLAEHFDLASSAGGTARAFSYRMLAGEDAHRRLSFEEATRHLARAVALFDAANPPDGTAEEPAARDARRCELLISLATVARKAGDGTTTSQAWDAAIPLARRLDDPRYLARLVVAAPFVGSEDARLTALHEEALGRLGSEPTPLRAVALAGLAVRLRDTLGTRARRTALLREALAITSEADHVDARFYVLDAFLSAMDQADLIPERLRHSTEMRAQAQATGGVWMTAQARAHRSAILLQQGRLAEALEEARDLAALAKRHPWPRVEWLATGVRFVELLLDGRLADAEECCLRAGELASQTRQPTGEMALATQLPVVLREQRRLGEVLGLIEAYVTEHPAFTWTLEIARSYLGDGEALRRLVTSVAGERAAMLRHESENFRVVGLCWLSDACAGLGHAEHADSIHAELAPYADAWAVGGIGFYTFGSIRRALGNLDLLRGRPGRAVEELTRALEVHTQPGATLLRLWTSFDLARALRARAHPGDLDEAERLLGDAHAAACRHELTALRHGIEALRSA